MLAFALVRDAEVDERLGHLAGEPVELLDRRVELAIGEVEHREVVRDLVGPDARVRRLRGREIAPRARDIAIVVGVRGRVECDHADRGAEERGGRPARFAAERGEALERFRSAPGVEALGERDEDRRGLRIGGRRERAARAPDLLERGERGRGIAGGHGRDGEVAPVRERVIGRGRRAHELERLRAVARAQGRECGRMARDCERLLVALREWAGPGLRRGLLERGHRDRGIAVRDLGGCPIDRDNDRVVLLAGERSLVEGACTRDIVRERVRARIEHRDDRRRIALRRAVEHRQRIRRLVEREPRDAEVAHRDQVLIVELVRAGEQRLRRHRIVRRELADRDADQRLHEQPLAARRALDRLGLLEHRDRGVVAAVRREECRAVDDADGRVLRKLGHDRRELRCGAGGIALREQRFTLFDVPIGIRGGLARSADLVERRERIAGMIATAKHEREPHREPPPLGLELARGLELPLCLAQVPARRLRFTNERVARGTRLRRAVEIAPPERERAVRIAQRERALAIDEEDLRMLLGERLELAQALARLLAIRGRRGPCGAELRAQERAASLGGRVLDGLVEQLERLLRLVRAQIGIAEIDLMARVLALERLGPVREVRLERGDRLGPLRGVVPVLAEQQLRVVARRLLRDDLLEQRHAVVRISGQHQLRAERGQHLRIGRCQRLRALHQRDAILVLLLRGIDRRAQHVRFDASRVQRDRLIERLRRVVQVARPERRTALLDERRTLVLGLIRALCERGRRGDQQRDEDLLHAAPRPDCRCTGGSYWHSTNVTSSSAT